jgi:hypothetical protein
MTEQHSIQNQKEKLNQYCYFLVGSGVLAVLVMVVVSKMTDNAAWDFLAAAPFSLAGYWVMLFKFLPLEKQLDNNNPGWRHQKRSTEELEKELKTSRILCVVVPLAGVLLLLIQAVPFQARASLAAVFFFVSLAAFFWSVKPLEKEIKFRQSEPDGN